MTDEISDAAQTFLDYLSDGQDHVEGLFAGNVGHGSGVLRQAAKTLERTFYAYVDLPGDVRRELDRWIQPSVKVRGGIPIFVGAPGAPDGTFAYLACWSVPGFDVAFGRLAVRHEGETFEWAIHSYPPASRS